MTPYRYPENSQGDFYVENDICLNCGFPEVLAPDLIEHSKIEYGHCYFKKQPETEEEIERAINAIAGSCVSGLRYGGKDEKILKRLYEIGEGAQCDHKPKGGYKAIIWNKVTFKYQKTTKELAGILISQFLLENPYSNKQIINLEFINNNYFEFIYRWTDGFTGNIFKCYFLNENEFKLEINVEKNGNEISLRGTAMIINEILRFDQSTSEILWFDKDNNNYTETELR